LYKAYKGYQILMMDGEVINASKPLNWSRMGLEDPNTMARRNFEYYILPNVNSPTRIDANQRKSGVINASRWLSIDLSSGVLNKSVPF
ncbi:MAG TPA: hypothetical protein PLU24_04655, partial [Candidatus Omnitrophota bacterium]|nr:hypothetical protein [Candidatus Omnitrophota bacterium]